MARQSKFTWKTRILSLLILIPFLPIALILSILIIILGVIVDVATFLFELTAKVIRSYNRFGNDLLYRVRGF